MFAGCIDAHSYVITHRDGRSWCLDGEPRGHGWNGMLHWGTYTFRDRDGFIITVDKSDCQVRKLDE